MKNEIEDIPMAFVWYVVGGIAAIGLIGLFIALTAISSSIVLSFLCTTRPTYPGKETGESARFGLRYRDHHGSDV
jgi:hypothetical protein